MNNTILLEDEVAVKKTELARLEKVDLRMNLLEAGGVDNWDWYGESIHGDHIKPSFDEECDEIDARYGVK